MLLLETAFKYMYFSISETTNPLQGPKGQKGQEGPAGVCTGCGGVRNQTFELLYVHNFTLFEYVNCDRVIQIKVSEEMFKDLRDPRLVTHYKTSHCTIRFFIILSHSLMQRLSL